MKAEKKIYFHVGTGKTGTTYLQIKVFPFVKGLHYIPTNRYRKIYEILKESKEERLLVSREFDRQMEREVKKFAEHYPNNTQPIVVFRRQDSYIASQYRRFVKNGYQGDLTSFLDLENDNGFFKQEHLTYMDTVALLEEQFGCKPLVYFHDDMKKDQKAYVERMLSDIGASVDYDAINQKSFHTSYSEKQLKALRSFAKIVPMEKKRVFNNGILHFLNRSIRGPLRYIVLYVAKVFPNAFFSKEPLISTEELECVRLFFEKDWMAVREYAIPKTD